MKNQTTEAITLTESKRLIEIESDIKRHKDGFIAVWLGLKEIRDYRLYRSDYETFEDYCQKKWGFSRQHVNQSIAGAEAVKSLPPNLETMVSNPRQARALAAVPEDARESVMKKVAATGPVSAKAIENIGSKIEIESKMETKVSQIPPSKPKEEKPIIELDKEGFPIPEALLPLWNRRQDVQELLTAITRIKGAIKKAQEEKDILFVEVVATGALADLGNAFSNIQTALPYAVCTRCHGLRPEKCRLCSGRGMISSFAWKTFVTAEEKNIREKQKVKR